MSMGSALTWQARRDPDRPALTMGAETYTRAELDRAANRLARTLAQRGVEHDDRVAVIMPTGPRHQITCFALWKLGALVIPLPARTTDAELSHLANQAEPKLIVGVEAGRIDGYASLPVDFEADPSLPDDPLPEVVATMWKASTSGGSTGLPKLIWEHRSSEINPTEPYPLLRIQMDDVVLHPAAAYHNASFSQTNWALCWGSHVLLMDRFDAQEWLSLVGRHRVRWAYLVPTMMSRILALPDDVRQKADVSSLETVIHMAAPCPPWVKEAWIDWIGPEKIWEIYGGTEGFGATIINGVEWLEHRGSVGRAQPSTEIRDDSGKLLPTGEIGTVWFYPPAGNPLGHSPDVAQTFGDMGRLDEDGYLYLADRRTDMILTGGVNIYPAEVEGIIEQMPGVVSAAVIGLPDPDLGNRAHAIIEMAPGHELPETAEVTRFLESRLSRHKIPYTCEFVSWPLRDEAGKIRRKRLREDRLEGPAGIYATLR
jgi:bile acid-coenzyme A ligase